MTSPLARTFGAALLACLPVLPACKILDPKPDYKVARPDAIVPQRFLSTDNAQLKSWLDQAVRVSIADVPLNKVFAQPAFSGVNYRLVGIGDNEDAVDIDSIGMSRRQMLYAIAHEHALKMTPVPGYGSQPSVIEVRPAKRIGDESREGS